MNDDRASLRRSFDSLGHGRVFPQAHAVWRLFFERPRAASDIFDSVSDTQISAVLEANQINFVMMVRLAMAEVVRNPRGSPSRPAINAVRWLARLVPFAYERGLMSAVLWQANPLQSNSRVLLASLINSASCKVPSVSGSDVFPALVAMLFAPGFTVEEGSGCVWEPGVGTIGRGGSRASAGSLLSPKSSHDEVPRPRLESVTSLSDTLSPATTRETRDERAGSVSSVSAGSAGSVSAGVPGSVSQGQPGSVSSGQPGSVSPGSGSDHPSPSLRYRQPNLVLEANRADVLRCIIVLCSGSLYQLPSQVAVDGSEALTYLVTSVPRPQLVALASSLFNSVARATTTSGVDAASPASVAESRRYYLTYCVQLLVMMVAYPVPAVSDADHAKMKLTRKSNVVRGFFAKLSNPDEVAWLVGSLLDLLKPPLAARSAAHPVPGLWAAEATMLLWELLQCNPQVKHQVAEGACADVVTALVYNLQWAAQQLAHSQPVAARATSTNLARVSAYFLLFLSSDGAVVAPIYRPVGASYQSLPPSARVSPTPHTTRDYAVTSIANLLVKVVGCGDRDVSTAPLAHANLGSGSGPTGIALAPAFGAGSAGYGQSHPANQPPSQPSAPNQPSAPTHVPTTSSQVVASLLPALFELVYNLSSGVSPEPSELYPQSSDRHKRLSNGNARGGLSYPSAAALHQVIRAYASPELMAIHSDYPRFVALVVRALVATVVKYPEPSRMVTLAVLRNESVWRHLGPALAQSDRRVAVERHHEPDDREPSPDPLLRLSAEASFQSEPPSETEAELHRAEHEEQQRLEADADRESEWASAEATMRALPLMGMSVSATEKLPSSAPLGRRWGADQALHLLLAVVLPYYKRVLRTHDPQAIASLDSYDIVTALAEADLQDELQRHFVPAELGPGEPAPVLRLRWTARSLGWYLSLGYSQVYFGVAAAKHYQGFSSASLIKNLNQSVAKITSGWRGLWGNDKPESAVSESVVEYLARSATSANPWAPTTITLFPLPTVETSGFLKNLGSLASATASAMTASAASYNPITRSATTQAATAESLAKRVSGIWLGSNDSTPSINEDEPATWSPQRPPYSHRNSVSSLHSLNTLNRSRSASVQNTPRNSISHGLQ
ncbi:hypothetical protein DICA1_F38468 [Diutina catenulata]